MKRFLNLELKIDQRKLHSDQTGRFRGLVFNECHRHPGGNPQTQKSPQRGLIPSIYQKKDLLLKALVLFLFSERIDN